MSFDNFPSFSENRYFVQHLHDTEALPDKFSLLEKEAVKCGFDAALYTFIPKLTQLSDTINPVIQYSTSYSSRMLDYKEQNEIKNDFTVKLLTKGHTTVIDWWEQAEHLPLTNKEKQVNRRSKAHGVAKGITFPTLNSDMGIAYMSVVSFNKAYANKPIAIKTLNYLKKCASQYHNHVMTHQGARYNFIAPILNTFTPKKVMLIKYIISGKPINSISEHENISTRYAEKLLIEIRKQFGNISTNELIYFLGLLNIPENI